MITGGTLLSIVVLFLLSIVIFLYIGHINKKDEKREEEKMARNIVCEVDAPEGLMFQGCNVISMKIANDGDYDGYYVAQMELEEHFDAVLEEFIRSTVIKGQDF